MITKIAFLVKAASYCQQKNAAENLAEAVMISGIKNPVMAAGMGALPGAAIGAGIGALVPSTDAKGKTHRWRNALIGAGILGAGGAAVGLGGRQLIVDQLNPEQQASLPYLKSLN